MWCSFGWSLNEDLLYNICNVIVRLASMFVSADCQQYSTCENLYNQGVRMHGLYLLNNPTRLESCNFKGTITFVT